jgi:agmatine deiminase
MLGSAGEADQIKLYDYRTDDIWIRDFGPLFLIAEDGGALSVADWRFNAWGGKFPEQERDDRAAAWMADHLRLRRFSFDTVLEGGAIESNGAGQLLTTEAVLLHPNRNGETTLERMQQTLCSGLGVNSMLWFNSGLSGDDTDGHIDNLARFFKSDGILIAETNDSNNPNFKTLQENTARLQNFRTPGGHPFASVQMPLPRVLDEEGTLLAASYLNYLVLNGAVLAPVFGQPESDHDALGILSDCFPEREVIAVDCSDIIREGGALHCMSLNQPDSPES